MSDEQIFRCVECEKIWPRAEIADSVDYPLQGVGVVTGYLCNQCIQEFAEDFDHQLKAAYQRTSTPQSMVLLIT